MGWRAGWSDVSGPIHLASLDNNFWIFIIIFFYNWRIIHYLDTNLSRRKMTKSDKWFIAPRWHTFFIILFCHTTTSLLIIFTQEIRTILSIHHPNREMEDVEQVKSEALQMMGVFQVLPKLLVFDLDHTLWPFYWYTQLNTVLFPSSFLFILLECVNHAT